jgi:4-amino-4-deoxy-L-arabinose transferase-like glycosyltransferase
VINQQSKFDYQEMTTLRSRPTDLLLLAGFCGFLFFFGLASFGLVGADEPRYAQVAREMFARHDWITPTFGGKPWLEKPALYYWQTILAYRIFGVSDWAARLASAVDATAMVLAVYLFLRRFRPGFQLDGALMTASAGGVIGFARAASMDMPLAASFTMALLAWYAWRESGGKLYLAGFYVFLGLGTLAKGPVPLFLAAVILAIFAAAQRDFRLLWRTLWIPGILLFCAVTLPWYIAVQWRNPEFFRVFILEHNVARFGTNLYHHTQPFWFYLPVTLLGLAPWTVFVLAAMAQILRIWWAEGRKLFRSEDALNVFLILWLIVPVLFFSISQSKLPGYILPALPAGTLLLAKYVRRHVASEERAPLWLIILHSLAAALMMVPALMIQYLVLQHRLPWGTAAEISLVVAGVLAVGIAVTLYSSLGLRGLRFVTLIPVVLALAVLLRIGTPALDSALSARPLAREITNMETKPLPLALFRVSRETEYGLAFYRNQTLARYEWGQMPSKEHLLVAPEGSQAEIVSRAAGRRVSHLGTFAPQHLEYFWVAGTP